ncbi:unnamed protein product, partial [Brassica oleracea]
IFLFTFLRCLSLSTRLCCVLCAHFLSLSLRSITFFIF